MRIDLGARVRTKDGQAAGHVKHAIWDPRRNEITEYVVSTGGLLSLDAIVSSEMLSGTGDGSEVLLDITKDALDELARYESSEYTTPPAGWLAPTAYGFPVSGYLFPVTDSEIDRTIERPPPDEKVGRGPNLRKGMKVRDAAGDVIGDVTELRVDDQTGELRGLLVRRDGGTLEVDAENIDQVGDEVRLVSAGSAVRRRSRT